MKSLATSALKYHDGSLPLPDQRLLHGEMVWLPCDSADTMISMIKRLQIRGAPLIGIGASLLLAHLAEQGVAANTLRRAVGIESACQADF